MARYTDLDIEDVADWPLPAQGTVLMVLLLVLQVMGYWWWLKPQTSELEQLKQYEVELKQTIQIKTSQIAALPQLQMQLDELSRRFDDLSQQLPVQNELATILAAVNEQGLKNSLTFTRIDWGIKEKQPFLHRLPLNIELTGEYNNIGEFAQAIATLPRIINFLDVEWHRVSPESTTIHFRGRAYTYQFKSELNDED